MELRLGFKLFFLHCHHSFEPRPRCHGGSSRLRRGGLVIGIVDSYWCMTHMDPRVAMISFDIAPFPLVAARYGPWLDATMHPSSRFGQNRYDSLP